MSIKRSLEREIKRKTGSQAVGQSKIWGHGHPGPRLEPPLALSSWKDLLISALQRRPTGDYRDSLKPAYPEIMIKDLKHGTFLQIWVPTNVFNHNDPQGR